MGKSWRKKSKKCKQETADVTVTHLSTMGATWIQLYCSSSSRSEQRARQQFAILQGELDKVFEAPTQTAPVTLVQVLKGQLGKEQSTAEGDVE